MNMSETDVTVIANELLTTCLLLVGPSILASLVVGLVISIFQAVTSIQEQTLSFAPRILAVGIVIALTLSWSLGIAVDYTHRMIMYYVESGI